jgi:hypothetical protein
MSNLDYFIVRLAANAEVIRHQLVGVSPEQAQWRPALDKWSLLEVINHLSDEECHDFRYRLDVILHSPGECCPKIDPSQPARWVLEHNYNGRELSSSLEAFAAERSRSIEWLRSLSNIEMDAECSDPQFGVFKAGDIVGSWLAHDLIHIRQINRLHFEFMSAQLGSYSTRYAGTW